MKGFGFVEPTRAGLIRIGAVALSSACAGPRIGAASTKVSDAPPSSKAMEVFLNSIWLVMAIGAFLFWQAEREPGHREYTSRCRLLALACALVLLFPVISLTDDLHAEQPALEDSSRSVMKARNMVQGCLRAGGPSLTAVVTNAGYSNAVLHLFSGVVLLVETRLFCLTPISAHEGRSPPSKL